jgi:hypothetical protein
MLRDIIKILLKHEQILKNEFDFNNIPERFMSAKLTLYWSLLLKEELLNTWISFSANTGTSYQRRKKDIFSAPESLDILQETAYEF